MADYLVTHSIPEVGADKAMAVRERIVRAKNQAAALSFVVADSITVDKLSISDAMRLAKAGVEVEEVK